jgi:predicted secreted protein
MTIFNGFVLYAVLWFVTLFVVLPLRLTTQAETGDVVRGTHGSAPSNPQMKRRLGVTTAISAALWVVIAGIIISGVIGVEDLDFYLPRER